MAEAAVEVDGLIETVVAVAAVAQLKEAEELQVLSEIKKRKLLFSTARSESSL